jgi:Bifunctional DNA primase/polymerase, N-terminal
LVVVDVDKGLKSKEDALAWARKHDWPATYTVISGRKGPDIGVHFYFRGFRETPNVKPTDIFNDGVIWEIRHNGYVVCSGGLHKSGAWYEALEENQDIAPLPEFLRTYTRKKKATVDDRGNPNVAGTLIDGQLRLGDLNGKLVVSDQRHYYLMNRAGHLRREGGNQESIFAMLKDIRDQLCEHPCEIKDEELNRMAAYVSSRPVDLKLGLEWTTSRKRKQHGMGH